MDPAYRARYAELSSRHWWWLARDEMVLAVIDALALPARPRILDVGCGAGAMLEKLADRGELEAVELEAARVSLPPAVRLHVGEFGPSFDAGRDYSLILFLDVLEHMPRPEAALSRARDLLVPGGCIVATVPAFRVLWTAHDDLNRHLTRYTRRSFEALARRARLRPFVLRYSFHWLFLAKLARRGLEWLWGAEAAMPSIPSALPNELLRRFCVAEHRATRALDLPFGSSLMAVLAPG